LLLLLLLLLLGAAAGVPCWQLCAAHSTCIHRNTIRLRK
jgi:hypothetical protein